MSGNNLSRDEYERQLVQRLKQAPRYALEWRDVPYERSEDGKAKTRRGSHILEAASVWKRDGRFRWWALGVEGVEDTQEEAQARADAALREVKGYVLE